jgi:hypothetical protein
LLHYKLTGTQSVGEDGRLFVRGGEANETQTFVDGIRWPYNATIGNVPTRGRFSPFCSADFQQEVIQLNMARRFQCFALNTEDNPAQNKTEISLMTVGVGLGNTQNGIKVR